MRKRKRKKEKDATMWRGTEREESFVCTHYYLMDRFRDGNESILHHFFVLLSFPSLHLVTYITLLVVCAMVYYI